MSPERMPNYEKCFEFVLIEYAFLFIKLSISESDAYLTDNYNWTKKRHVENFFSFTLWERCLAFDVWWRTIIVPRMQDVKFRYEWGVEIFSKCFSVLTCLQYFFIPQRLGIGNFGNISPSIWTFLHTSTIA